MPEKPRKTGSKGKIKDLPSKKPSKSEEGLTKGGVMANRHMFGGISGPSATTPKMTDDGTGNETVDGT